MADNLITGSTGSTVAFAQLTFSGDSAYVAGQFIGILSGSEGAWTYTLLVGGAGAVTAGVPRCTLASDDPAVVALQIMDDWDETNRCAVNLIAGQVGVAAGAGAVSALTQRVTLASDDPGVGHLATIAGDTTDIETAVEIIDNVVHVDDAAFTLGSSSGVMIMGFAGTQSVDANDACALACSTSGALFITAASGAIASGAIASGAIADMIVDDAAFTPATSRVLMAGFEADETGTDSVDEGDGGAARMTLDRKVITTAQPHTAGGLSIFRSIDLDEGALEVVKASPGCVYGMWVTNTATTTRWVKFYDATSGTIGTGTPVITIGIPGNSSDDISGMFSSANGIMFTTGISVGASTGVADNDTGAPAANDVIVNIYYK